MPADPSLSECDSSRKPSPSPADLDAVYEAALTRYFADRHSRVDDFVGRHLSLRGTLRIHRRALGLDILCAPINLMFTVPTAALKLCATLARWAGKSDAAHRLDIRNLFLETAVSRHITGLIEGELLAGPGDEAGQPDQSDPLLP